MKWIHDNEYLTVTQLGICVDIPHLYINADDRGKHETVVKRVFLLLNAEPVIGLAFKRARD